MIHNERRTLKNSLLWEIEQYLDFQEKSYAERSSSVEPRTETANRLLDFYMQTKNFYKYNIAYEKHKLDEAADMETWLKDNIKHPYVILWHEDVVSFTNNDDAVHFKLRYGKAQ